MMEKVFYLKAVLRVVAFGTTFSSNVTDTAAVSSTRIACARINCTSAGSMIVVRTSITLLTYPLRWCSLSSFGMLLPSLLKVYRRMCVRLCLFHFYKQLFIIGMFSSIFLPFLRIRPMAIIFFSMDNNVIGLRFVTGRHFVKVSGLLRALVLPAYVNNLQWLPAAVVSDTSLPTWMTITFISFAFVLSSDLSSWCVGFRICWNEKDMIGIYKFKLRLDM